MLRRTVVLGGGVVEAGGGVVVFTSVAGVTVCGTEDYKARLLLIKSESSCLI